MRCLFSSTHIGNAMELGLHIYVQFFHIGWRQFLGYGFCVWDTNNCPDFQTHTSKVVECLFVWSSLMHGLIEGNGLVALHTLLDALLTIFSYLIVLN